MQGRCAREQACNDTGQARVRQGRLLPPLPHAGWVQRRASESTTACLQSERGGGCRCRCCHMLGGS